MTRGIQRVREKNINRKKHEDKRETQSQTYDRSITVIDAVENQTKITASIKRKPENNMNISKTI